MAGGSHGGGRAPLLAVTVVTPRRLFSAPSPLEAINAQAQLAEDLGAEVLRVEGRHVAATLAQLARERHVTQIVIVQPTRSHWDCPLYGSVVNQLLRFPIGANIHVVRAASTITPGLNRTGQSGKEWERWLDR